MLIIWSRWVLGGREGKSRNFFLIKSLTCKNWGKGDRGRWNFSLSCVKMVKTPSMYKCSSCLVFKSKIYRHVACPINWSPQQNEQRDRKVVGYLEVEITLMIVLGIPSHKNWPKQTLLTAHSDLTCVTWQNCLFCCRRCPSKYWQWANTRSTRAGSGFS